MRRFGLAAVRALELARFVLLWAGVALFALVLLVLLAPATLLQRALYGRPAPRGGVGPRFPAW